MSSLSMLALVIGLGAACGCGRNGATHVARRLSADAEIPVSFSPATTLSIGDPTVQKQLQLSGELANLGFKPAFQNISGGPSTAEAFRAGVLDGGAVGDTPPIHAAFTGIDVKIIAVQVREKPSMQLAIAPGSHVSNLAELRGKRIAYAPGQAQGALILRVLARAGLATSEVQLIELTSYEFKDALASRQVDAAPLSGAGLRRYLNQYGGEGATSIAHGVRDTVSFFYVRSAVLEDADKAAAFKQYVKFRTKAQLWAAAHPKEWLAAYYVEDQGLTPEEGRYLIESAGTTQYPDNWSDVISLTQETIDLLVRASGQQRFDAQQIFDRRFESIGAEVARAGG